MTRWTTIKNWVVKQSKSKPAQLCLSVAAGGSFASGMYWVGDFFLSYLSEQSLVFYPLKLILYVLTISAGLTTTILTASGLAVSIHKADKVDEEVVELKRENKTLRRKVAKHEETINFLIKSEHSTQQSNREHTAALRQFLTVADIFTKYIPDAEDKNLCEAILLPMEEKIAMPADLSIHIQHEPYFEEAEEDEPPTQENLRNADDKVDSIELKNITFAGSAKNPRNYGSLFSQSPSASSSDQLDIDLESGLPAQSDLRANLL